MHRVEWVLQPRDRSPTFLSTARRQLFIALVLCGVRGGERGLPLGWGRYLRVGRGVAVVGCAVAMVCLMVVYDALFVWLHRQTKRVHGTGSMYNNDDSLFTTRGGGIDSRFLPVGPLKVSLSQRFVLCS